MTFWYSWEVRHHSIHRPTYLSIICSTFLLVSLLAGCGAPTPSGDGGAATPSAQTNTAEMAVNSSPIVEEKALRVRVLDEIRNPRFTFRILGERVAVDIHRIDLTTRVLRGFGPLDGKRKYKEDSGEDFLDVVSRRHGFELRRPDGEKIWHVRVDGDRVRVSSAKHGRYILRRTEKHVVLRHDEKIIGRSRAHADGKAVLMRDAESKIVGRMFVADHPASAALMLADIPSSELAILAVELLLRD